MIRPYTLVTGAAGFIAFHWIVSLLEEGIPVVGVDNFDPFYNEADKRANIADLREIARVTGTPFRFEALDITKLSAPDLADLEIDLVTHLAAKAGVRPSLASPVDYVTHNVAGTMRVLEFMHARKIERLLFGSSSSVYGNDTPAPFREDSLRFHPVSPYAATKQAAELLCYPHATLYGLRVAALRFFTVFGPRQRPDLAIHSFTKKMLAGEPIPLFGEGGTVRDYTYVSDIVAGLSGARAWLSKQDKGTLEAFNLASGRPVSLRELVSALEQATGVKATTLSLAPQPGDVDATFGCIEKSRKFLAYEPRTPLAEGLSRFVQWFLKRPRTAAA